MASVLQQTIRDLECIVVDDSSDGDAEVPDSSRVRRARGVRRGCAAAARNAGIEASDGEYVCFLDDDDRFVEGRVERALAVIGSRSFAVCRAVDQHGNELPGRVLEGDVRHRILDGYTPSLGTVTCRRGDVPHFDERLSAVEDVEWWLRAAHAGPFAFDGSVGMVYRVHGDERPGYGERDRTECRRRMLELHAGYFAEHPRARSFQLMRIGVSSAKSGDRRGAATAFVESLRARPTLRALGQLARTAVRR